MSNVLFPGIEDRVAESAAVVMIGSEILKMDLEEVIVLADLAARDASHPTDTRFGRSRDRLSRPFAFEQSAFGFLDLSDL